MAMFFCIVKVVTAMLEFQESEGWSFIEVIIFVPALLILFVLDIIVKWIFKNKSIETWAIEFIMLGLGIWYFIEEIS